MSDKLLYSLVAAILISFTVYVNFLMPVEGKNVVIIKRGELAFDVAHKLKEKGVIEREDIFISLTRALGLEDELKSGLYTFREKLPELRVVLYLSRQSKGGKLIKVRIIEGWELDRIASVLSQKLGIDSLKFLRLASDTAFIQSLKVHFPEIDDPPTLEGFILPDTYKLPWGVREDKLLLYFVEHLVSVWRKKFKERADSLGMSLKEVLTLASIIEKEAQVDKEKPLISAVFHNRLKLGRPLQSCATVEYVLPKRKKILSYRELRINSPYNTYIVKGLPPGPIASPSISSIEAALYPADVDYLYFVSKGDGTHFFSRTLREHLRYKRLARRLMEERERMRERADSLTEGQIDQESPKGYN